MSEDQVEKVARAIQQWHHDNGKLRPSWQEATGQAEAVLSAYNERLREALFDSGNWQIRCRHLLSCLDRRGEFDREDVIFVEEIRSALSHKEQVE
jgi:hypothetical protein